MQSKECHHPIENEKSFPLMSDTTRYDEITKNGGRSKMWSVMLSCTITYQYIHLTTSLEAYLRLSNLSMFD